MHDTPDFVSPKRGSVKDDMGSSVKSCPEILVLLQRYYEEHADRGQLEAAVIEAAEVPEPYHALLVHESDMTTMLSDFHHEKIELRVLERVLTVDDLFRHIVLEGVRTRQIVEYGAIRINLNVINEEARSEIIEGRIPLGGIRNAHGVIYKCAPGAFFKIRSNEWMNQLLLLYEPHWLYGRCNSLSLEDGQTIAEVVEILPPNDTYIPKASK